MILFQPPTLSPTLNGLWASIYTKKSRKYCKFPIKTKVGGSWGWPYTYMRSYSYNWGQLLLIWGLGPFGIWGMSVFYLMIRKYGFASYLTSYLGTWTLSGAVSSSEAPDTSVYYRKLQHSMQNDTAFWAPFTRFWASWYSWGPGKDWGSNTISMIESGTWVPDRWCLWTIWAIVNISGSAKGHGSYIRALAGPII